MVTFVKVGEYDIEILGLNYVITFVFLQYIHDKGFNIGFFMFFIFCSSHFF